MSDRSPKKIGDVSTEGMRPDQIEQLERAYVQQRREAAAKRVKPSDRLNQTGKKRKDPIVTEIEMYAALNEKIRRDLVLMPMMMGIAIDNVRRTGISGSTRRLEIDEQFINELNKAASKVLASWPESEREAIATKIVADAQYILSGCQADHGRHVLLACAYLLVQAADEGAHAAPASESVVCSLAMLQEAQQEGTRGLWDWNDTAILKVAENIRTNARLRSYL